MEEGPFPLLVLGRSESAAITVRDARRELRAGSARAAARFLKGTIVGGADVMKFAGMSVVATVRQ